MMQSDSTPSRENWTLLNECIRSEFDKLSHGKSMISAMFMSRLNQGVSLSNSEIDRRIEEFRERMNVCFEDIVCNGLDILLATAKKNMLKQLNVIHKTRPKRIRVETVSEYEHIEVNNNNVPVPPAKRRRLNDNHKEHRDDRTDGGGNLSDCQILNRGNEGTINVGNVGLSPIDSQNSQRSKFDDNETHSRSNPADEGSVLRHRPVAQYDANSDGKIDSNSETNSVADLMHEYKVKVEMNFDISAVELQAKNDDRFSSYSNQQRKQHIDRILRIKCKTSFDDFEVSRLIRCKASTYYDHPMEYIDVKEDDDNSHGERFSVSLRTYNVQHRKQLSKYLRRNERRTIQFEQHITNSAVYWFRIYLPNEGRYKTKRMPLKIVHSKDWTANEMIKDILKLAVDIPLIGYAFFADIIRYITKHELEEESDYHSNKVDLSLLNKLDPSRFLIYHHEDLKNNPVAYYKTDRYNMDFSSVGFEIQFLPLFDPLLTGVTMIRAGQEHEIIEIGSDRKMLTQSVWIQLRNPKNEPLGITRCIIKRGQTLREVCEEHMLPSDIGTSSHGDLYRCGVMQNGTASMVPWSKMNEKVIFQTLKPDYGNWIIYVPNNRKFFCKHLCGKEYSLVHKYLDRHEKQCSKRH